MIDFSRIFKKSDYNPLPKSLIAEYNKNRPLGPQPYSCYAPFRSIYFGHHGKAVACCYNRTHVMGEYPKQSIKDIWFGAEANKLRDFIKHNDFSLGCHGCKSQLVAGNFDAVKAKQYDERVSNTNRYPSVMEFELSNVCNLECEMCSGDFSSLIRAKREKMPPIHSPYDAGFVFQLEEFIPYLEEVKFYGGEPFLIDIYYQIWERIAAINPKVRVSVQTNATVLNNRVKNLLHEIDFHINVSLDALTKDVYEGIRKNADFDRVMENISYFHQYCRERNTFFGISVCAMQQNWKELPKFVNYCNELNVPVYFHTVFNPPHCAIRSLSTAEIEQVYQHLSEFDFPERTAVQKKNRRHFSDFTSQIVAWRNTSASIDPYRGKSTMEKLRSLIRIHIANDSSVADSKKEARIDNVISKLNKLEEELGEEFVNRALSQVDISDTSLLDNIVSYFDKLPVSALVVMAKTAFK